MNTIINLIEKTYYFLWGDWIHLSLPGGTTLNLPLLVLLLVPTGIFCTIRTRFLQIRMLPDMLRALLEKAETGHKGGSLSALQALIVSTATRVGMGNLVGIVAALSAGGAGALFWMWVAAFVGMATKYSECLLSVKYRTVAEDGHIVGGPFYYIEKGMGTKWRWLAKIFAFFGVCVGLFGIGTFTQINGITNAVQTFFDPDKTWTVHMFGMDYSWTVVIAGVLLSICVALVVIGGIKRISSVSQVVVPFMAVAYVVVVLIILLTHLGEIPGAFRTIIESAFGLRAAAGGALGAVLIAMQKGIARGIFSNEAGLGSAPIAAAAALTDSPGQQGLISMLGTFIDTIVICTMTGLSIVIAGTWNIGLEGVAVTTKAFQMTLPFPEQFSSFILMICLVFFAFTTILGWDYYSEKCLEYLSNGNQKVVKGYRWLYILAVFIGPYMTVSAVWTIADIFNGLMAIPNLIALVALSGVVVSETKIYLKRIGKVS